MTNRQLRLTAAGRDPDERTTADLYRDLTLARRRGDLEAEHSLLAKIVRRLLRGRP
jgi:hypothetical protein